MVTIIDNIYPSKSIAASTTTNKTVLTNELLMNHLKMTNTSKNNITARNSDYIDIPLLVSDHEGYSDDEDSTSAKSSVTSGHEKASVTAEQVKRSMKYASARSTSASVEDTAIANADTKKIVTSDGLTAEEFQHERNQLMTIIVKYVATKITNSFPPESPRDVNPNELPLDKFLLLLTSRLQLTLPLFMRGIIYLFRYMDIIYLLRYLNQSNNFANYNEMDFSIKKLIVGCFKLTLSRERISKNWCLITGIPSNEVNSIVKTIVIRMNGKLTIKNIELVKLKLEIHRFVRMVTKTI